MPSSVGETERLLIMTADAFVLCIKMLVKLTPGVDSVNILCAAFTQADPKSAKKTDSLTVFFVLMGSVCVKALRKMLVKSTPGWLRDGCKSGSRLAGVWHQFSSCRFCEYS